MGDDGQAVNHERQYAQWTAYRLADFTGDGCHPRTFTLPGFFRSCEDLSMLAFEAGSHISTLGDAALAWCSLLKSICIPSSVEAIPNRCFNSCRKLLNLTFEPGSQVSILGEYGFAECSSVQSICIPSLVERIEKCCFSQCKSLSDATF
jgi:hypothetical protein